jgi:transcriptional regulator with XRE-family HTH domain
MSVRLTFSLSQVKLASMGTEFLAAFGRAVRQLRQERGMTQAELAERLSLGRTSITNLEKGRQSPPLSMLPEVARALGVDPVRIVETAMRTIATSDASGLAATVHDKDLRLWADQVIGGTLSGNSPPGHPQPVSRGRA